jgi:hypothetical protein
VRSCAAPYTKPRRMGKAGAAKAVGSLNATDRARSSGNRAGWPE